MNKLVRPGRPFPAPTNTEWLNLEDRVRVELTSEDPEWPVEGALLLGSRAGWRADGPGPQTLALVWPAPTRIERVRLVYEEHSDLRTHEFVLRATTVEGDREVVRQQFTFAPPGTTTEHEEYLTNLEGVTRLELSIVPAIDRSDAIATLKEWRVA